MFPAPVVAAVAQGAEAVVVLPVPALVLAVLLAVTTLQPRDRLRAAARLALPQVVGVLAAVLLVVSAVEVAPQPTRSCSAAMAGISP